MLLLCYGSRVFGKANNTMEIIVFRLHHLIVIGAQVDGKNCSLTIVYLFLCDNQVSTRPLFLHQNADYHLKLPSGIRVLLWLFGLRVLITLIWMIQVFVKFILEQMKLK